MMPALGPAYWAYGVLAASLVAAAITDLRTGKIRNYITYPAIAIGLVGHALVGGISGHAGQHDIGLVRSLVGLAVGFLPMLAFWWMGGIGGGDAKLMAAVGALAGAEFAVSAMMCGFVVAAAMAMIIMLRRKIVRRTMSRVLTFMWIAVSMGKPADPASADSPKVPFGLALCIGSAIAVVVEFVWRGKNLFGV
ncbi:MAG: prepilin peptidase [Planctomycetes bacterium]|nr:prepilin peptidase [Planctomycetota bacterium]